MEANIHHLLCCRESKTALVFEGGFDSLSAGAHGHASCQVAQQPQMVTAVPTQSQLITSSGFAAASKCL